jgi:hypothetical protein
VCQQPCSTSHTSDAVNKFDADGNTVAPETEHVTVEGCVSNVKKTVSKSETAAEDEYSRKPHVECEKPPRIEMPLEHQIQEQIAKDLAQNGNDIDINNPELREKSCSKGTVRPHRQRRKHRHRKHSYRGGGEDAMFEGERVSYLVGQCEAEKTHPSAGNGEERSVEEDDYVLRKLFKKSGETLPYEVCSLVLIFNLDTGHVSLDFMV